jgi:hypothetical protein
VPSKSRPSMTLPCFPTPKIIVVLFSTTFFVNRKPILVPRQGKVWLRLKKKGSHVHHLAVSIWSDSAACTHSGIAWRRDGSPNWCGVSCARRPPWPSS